MKEGFESHQCGYHETWTDYGYEWDCDYGTDIECDKCYFVVSRETRDKRKGKRLWAKVNQ